MAAIFSFTLAAWLLCPKVIFHSLLVFVLCFIIVFSSKLSFPPLFRKKHLHLTGHLSDEAHGVQKTVDASSIATAISQAFRSFSDSNLHCMASECSPLTKRSLSASSRYTCSCQLPQSDHIVRDAFPLFLVTLLKSKLLCDYNWCWLVMGAQCSHQVGILHSTW